VIVVVGSPTAQPTAQGIVAGGLSAEVARAAAAAGASVQIVGRVGEDAAGDLLLLALAANDVGHVAVLREPGRPTPIADPPAVASAGPDGSADPDGSALGAALLNDVELIDRDVVAEDDADPGRPLAGLSVDADDLELALRYVPDYRVLVVAGDLDPAALDAVVAAVAWSGAHLIVLLPDGSATPALPDAATVLQGPATDPDGAFAAMVASYAVALDQGDEPRDAFAAAQRSAGWAAIAD
jgi:ribokinase